MKPRMSGGFGSRKLLVFLLVAACLLALAWYVRNYVSLELLAAQEEQVRDAISANPWRAFVLGFSIYFLLSLVPGTGGKGMVYGWLFGFWQAVTIVTIGLTVAAMVIFSVSRFLFRESIERRYTSFLQLMNQHLEKEGAFYLLTLRMAHVPYSIINPVSGASRVRTWTFCWTTVVGLLPANALWVFVGMNLPSLQELAASGPETFIDPRLVVALVLLALFPILIRWSIGRFGIPAAGTGEPDSIVHQPRRERK